MSAFDEWFDDNGETVMQRDWGDERYDIAEYAFNAGRALGIKEGMERAVVIAENLYLPECHRECIEPRVCRTVVEAIHKEIGD